MKKARQRRIVLGLRLRERRGGVVRVGLVEMEESIIRKWKLCAKEKAASTGFSSLNCRSG